MTLGIPTFDGLAHPAAATAPDGYALYNKIKAREYIRARNNFIAFVARIIVRSDLTAEMKVAAIAMHPGRYLA
jgi:hypothetical protein